jgi:serine/threonine protein kinase
VLVAFSCRGRSFCSSCEKKRQLLWAEWLSEEVLAPVSHRHVVLTIPRLLRPLFRRRSELDHRVGPRRRRGRRRARRGLGHDARPGLVVSIATAGDLVQWNPHLHLLTSDVNVRVLANCRYSIIRSTPIPLAPGTRLGPYEILSALGAGGMGEVWKARDTRLNRLVAIKASLSRFSERLEREARAIAAVNHPHVCSLYDVGPDYLVMEYVEGKGLHGPVSLAQALELAGQILDALDAAHEKGIVHRDLKPGNILGTKSGVKVLDFGLAKITHPLPVESPSVVDTPAASLTAEGSLLSTLPYMSPAQVEGHDADARSAIFAFGVVLYELIAGTRPFTGKTPANLVASILKETPRPLFEMEPRTPRGLAEVVRTCLEKDGCATLMHLSGGGSRGLSVPRLLSGPLTAGTWASSSTTHSGESTRPAVHRKQ